MNDKKQKFYILVLILIFLTGLILRLRPYIANYPMWLDECSLALNIMHRGMFGYFHPLEHIQSAPPFFMMGTKFITYFFGINEVSLRFIPFVTSILSLPVFYLLSKKVLEKKWSIIAACFLFSANYQLIYYADEFKQYSSDVLICMLMILGFSKLNIRSASLKKAFLYGLLSFALVLFSMPAMFVVGAFALYSLVKFEKKKYINILGFMIPFFTIGPFYYIFTLLPAKNEMMKTFSSLWSDGFLTLNLGSIVRILRDNLSYFFGQDKFILFGVILFFWGLYWLFKNKTKESSFALLVFLCALIASFLCIYPIQERIALYLIPFLLLAILKPLDLISFKKKFLSFVIIILFCTFFNSYNFSHFSNYIQHIEGKKEDGRTITKILKQNYKLGETFVYNDASNSIYEYYSEFLGFKAKDYIIINLVRYDKDFYTGLLNQLPKGHTYWMYYAHDYSKQPVVPFVKEWAKDKEILGQYTSKKSYLLHIRL